MKLYVEGIGLRGPGLPNWAAGRAVLAGEAPYEPSEVALKPSPLLPPAEQRRTTDTVKLALAVGSEAVAHAGCRAEDLPSVFTSSGGDGGTITAILEILASDRREVSPTRFHNSVHNAPSGYWSIATQSRQPTTSLCGHDFSFGMGLLEAASQALAEARPVLLVAYDLPYPAVLHALRPIGCVFGIALVLAPEPGPRSLASLAIEVTAGRGTDTSLVDPDFERLRVGNPAARALPLLAGLARQEERIVALDYLGDGWLALRVSPLPTGAAA
jgi:hypothetical protein